jgi:hypothetical protein
MLTSITPLGERGRGNRWAVTTTAYAVGCALGGATTGLVSEPPARCSPAAGAARRGSGLPGRRRCRRHPRGRLPIGRRQVDERWLGRYRGWVYGLGFGYQLGLGVVTVVTSAATLAVLAVALLTQSPVVGALVGLVFGSARVLPALLVRRVDNPERLRGSPGGWSSTAQRPPAPPSPRSPSAGPSSSPEAPCEARPRRGDRRAPAGLGGAGAHPAAERAGTTRQPAAARGDRPAAAAAR